jgi:hypothetical protein
VPIAAILAEECENLNRRFRLRLAAGVRLDPAAFLEHVRERIMPLAMQIQQCLPERLRQAVLALYDVSLDLFAVSQLGPEAKSPWVRRVWEELLPTLPVLLGREARRVAGALSNAVLQVANQVGARPENWMERMLAAAPRCTSVSELMRVGVIAAWQAGMAQYRDAALTAAREAPLPASAACGITSPPDPSNWAAALHRLSRNRWLTVPEALAGAEPRELRSVGAVGAFRGFGGPFLQPPRVQLQKGRMFASDAEATFNLIADAQGAYFRRVNIRVTGRQNSTHAQLDANGVIRWNGLQLAVPQLVNPTSFACDGATLAVTIGTSHQVYLFAHLGASA